MSRPRFTVDVGNTSVGVCDWAEDTPRLRRWSDPREAARLLQGEVALVSVSPPRLAHLLEALGPAARPRVLSSAPEDLADAGLLASAGADRLAVALALRPGPAVAVDAGTAVTVELVDAAGRYRGGFIAPGPRAALAGLVSATAQLPALEVVPVPLQPGADTRAALLAGTWGLASGGVDRLVECALAALGSGAGIRVVATGGWGEAWSRATKVPGATFDELLVHRGIARWATGA